MHPYSATDMRKHFGSDTSYQNQLELYCIFARQDFDGCDANPNDTILLLKHYMCDAHLSQPPELVLPRARLDKLYHEAPQKYVPRNLLSDRRAGVNAHVCFMAQSLYMWLYLHLHVQLDGVCHRLALLSCARFLSNGVWSMFNKLAARL